jgi:hypothetical protein
MSETEERGSVLLWRKSSYSVGNGACTEVAAAGEIILVRDSAGLATGQLRLPAAAWRELIRRVKGGAAPERA